MSHYRCDKCDMEIKAPVCADCNEELKEKSIDVKGKKVKVCECPQCQGKIKCPQCCDSDMKCVK
jgi:hypothetical protein